MTNKILILIVLLLVVGCAETRMKYRKYNEKNQFKITESYLGRYVDEKTLETKCSYKYDAQLPTVYALSHKEMKAKFGEDIIGKYFPETNTIYYIKGDWDTLGHEYLHRLNATLLQYADKNGNIPPRTAAHIIIKYRKAFECLDEISADFLDTIWIQEEIIRRQKRRIRQMRNNSNR